MKLDILAIGVHPDDVELSCSGTLLKHKALGKKIGVLDLTRGELGTRGTAETRDAESLVASEILGLDVRENLGMRDGFFRNDEEHLLKIVTRIRKYQPEIILANAIDDRHPDHPRAAKLVNDAVFLSGLVKIETSSDGVSQKPWRPGLLLNFIQNTYVKPDILIDISDFWDIKKQAIAAYKTQFFTEEQEEGIETYISSSGFMKFLEGKGIELGKSIGVNYAEGFTSVKLLGVDNLFNLK